MKELLNEIDGLQDGSLMAHADGSVNKVNKETREKVEEILLKHSPYVFFGNAVKTELFGETVKHLTTLINQEKKEAVGGFADVVYESFRNHDLKIHALIEEYFESEGVKEHEKDDTKKYTCPDCGLVHSEEHHPPYCQDCIFKVTL